MSFAPEHVKQPAEERRITFDFTNKLVGADTVASVVTGSLITPAGITAGAPSVATPYVTARISGGTEDETYRISCRVLTAAGDTLELDVNMVVAEGQN